MTNSSTARVDKKIQGVELQLANISVWQRAASIEGNAATVLLANRWGRLMQKEMQANGGELTADLYKRTKSEVVGRGVAGHTVTHAARLLEQSWQHGDDLLKVRADVESQKLGRRPAEARYL